MVKNLDYLLRKEIDGYSFGIGLFIRPSFQLKDAISDNEPMEKQNMPK